MKIAILHEMLVKYGGAEKVVESFLRAFPEADLFTLIYDEKKIGDIFPRSKINYQVFKLKSQKIYNIFKKQRLCLPFMAQSVEQLDFSDYDVVLASSSGFAHGAITKPETKFIVYYHSPARYLWDYTHKYLQDLKINNLLKFFLKKLLLKLRIWDFIASKRVDLPIIASKHVSKRLKKYYKRNDYKVIYPPVEVEKFINYKNYTKKDYYVTIAALTEWKRLDILIEAFNKMTGKKLKIIGVGDYKKSLEKIVKNKNIKFLGYKSGDDLVKLLKEAKAFLFASQDDFGIAPVEAMAAGIPVFGLGKGGLLETVIPGLTGDFFYDEDGRDFIENFKKFEENLEAGKYKSENCKARAMKFSEKNFIKEIKKIVNNI